MSVREETIGAVRLITIDRPEVRNAVDPATAAALHEAFAAAEADEAVAARVLTGAGGHFCAGADLNAVSAETWSYDPEGADGPLGPTRATFEKPTIAAVEGYAVAGGLELALMCDMRVASDTAVFGVFCRRWGVPLVDGGTVRLPRLIGQSRALDMILTGRGVLAEEAYAWGLANRRAPAGGARDAAIALAEELAALPQACLRNDRASALAQWSLSPEDALRFEARIGLNSLLSGAAEGAARFVAGAGRGGVKAEES